MRGRDRHVEGRQPATGNLIKYASQSRMGMEWPIEFKQICSGAAKVGGL